MAGNQDSYRPVIAAIGKKVEKNQQKIINCLANKKKTKEIFYKDLAAKVQSNNLRTKAMPIPDRIERASHLLIEQSPK